jgi:ribosome biogenesis GTPase / thiamine phosphate phosphatase
VKVYESFQKLKREARHFSSSEYEKRKKDKSFSKMVEEVKRHQANN